MILKNIWCKWIEKRKNTKTGEKVTQDIQGKLVDTSWTREFM